MLAVAIESDQADVRKLVGQPEPSLRFALGTPEMVRAFGDVSAVSTRLLFDAGGHTQATLYGAPPGLHADAEAKLVRLLE